MDTKKLTIYRFSNMLRILLLIFLMFIFVVGLVLPYKSIIKIETLKNVSFYIYMIFLILVCLILINGIFFSKIIIFEKSIIFKAFLYEKRIDFNNIINIELKQKSFFLLKYKNKKEKIKQIKIYYVLFNKKGELYNVLSNIK